MIKIRVTQMFKKINKTNGNQKNPNWINQKTKMVEIK